ncbi:hypothetical protein NBC2815_00501 [Xanthomonas fragariae]|nr:hypothetical protein NBC2815_00501 [Xanthomonas fragariae]
MSRCHLTQVISAVGARAVGARPRAEDLFDNVWIAHTCAPAYGVRSYA